jgi:ribosomal protein S2
MLLSCHQNAGQNHDIKIANRCFENVAQFRYLGTTITNQSLIQEEIMRFNSGNACYHAVQKRLSSRLFKKGKIIQN